MTERRWPASETPPGLLGVLANSWRSSRRYQYPAPSTKRPERWRMSATLKSEIERLAQPGFVVGVFEVAPEPSLGEEGTVVAQHPGGEIVGVGERALVVGVERWVNT